MDSLPPHTLMLLQLLTPMLVSQFLLLLSRLNKLLKSAIGQEVDQVDYCQNVTSYGEEIYDSHCAKTTKWKKGFHRQFSDAKDYDHVAPFGG